MRSPLALFRFAAKAALNCVGFGVAGDFAVEVLPAVARDVWAWWGAGRDPSELRGDVQAIAQLDDVQAKRFAAQAVAEVVAEQPATPQQQERARAWLGQMPGVVRATQRRPADSSGRTVSASFPLNSPADLYPILPTRLPRYNKGDRPPALGGDWTLEELLGTGSFGEVWKASHPSLPAWAVKFCLDSSAKRSLQNEAKLLGRVIQEGKHPGIVQLINAALSHDPPFLVYEFVAGGELTTLIREWHRKPRTDLVDQAARLVRQLAGIVAFAHRLSPPIVHRDLKPANILLEPTAKGSVRMRVADFGIGGVVAEKGAGNAMATFLIGSHTPLYASPQQKNGEHPDPRDDVHALGVIWLHLLTGDLTLEPGHWRDELEDRAIPAAMLELLGNCVQRRPEKRPAHAGELETRLSAILGKGPPAERQPAKVSEPTTAPVAAPAGPNPVIARTLQTLTSASDAVAQAKQFAAEYRYAAAADVLMNLPKEACDPTLLAELVRKREEVHSLEDHILAALEKRQLVGLRPHLERFLYLVPNREDIKLIYNMLPPQPRDLVNSIGMKFVLVPPGKFIMGSPLGEAVRHDDEFPHEVAITCGFYLGVFPVTQADYQKVMGSNPAHFQGFTHPVEKVSWGDVVAFCQKLSQLEAERAAGRIYRLPTEAEWEYACRGGPNTSDKPFHFGKPTAALSSAQANFDGEHPYGGASKGPNRQKTTSVGVFSANALGLYDMHGNVWEWCSDWMDATYYKQSQHDDPLGPPQGNAHVLRGGCWNTHGNYCRAAYRHSGHLDAKNSYCGFRVVLLPF